MAYGRYQTQATTLWVAEIEICSSIGAGVFMRSPETRPIQQLQVNLELIANYIYLARRADTHSIQQHQYLDCAAEVMVEISHHPRVNTWH
jgi:hypothetical protein